MGSLVHNARDHATYGLFSAVPVDDLEDLVGGAPGRVEGLGEGGRLADLHAALHDAEEGHRDGPHRPPAAGLVAFLRVGGDFGLCDSIGSGKAADSNVMLEDVRFNVGQICPRTEVVQRVALGRFQGFIKSFLGSSTGQMAILQLQCSQARLKLQKELPRKSKQNI